MYRYHVDLRHSGFPVREGPGWVYRNHNANHAGRDLARPGGDAAFRDQLAVGRRDESHRQRRCREKRLAPRPKRRRQRRISLLFRMMFRGMVGGEGFEPPTYSV